MTNAPRHTNYICSHYTTRVSHHHHHRHTEESADSNSPQQPSPLPSDEVITTTNKMKQSPATIATAIFFIPSILQLATCDNNNNSPSSAAAQQQQQEEQQQAKGLQCYVCNSAQDPRCGDPFNPKTIELVNCNQFKPEVNSTVCRKNFQTVSLGDRVDVRVVRTCGYETSLKSDVTLEEQEEAAGRSTQIGEERCYKRAGTFEVMVTYCTCKTNACNVATTTTQMTSPLTTTTLSMLAASLILFATSNTIVTTGN